MPPVRRLGAVRMFVGGATYERLNRASRRVVVSREELLDAAALWADEADTAQLRGLVERARSDRLKAAATEGR